MTLDHAPRNPAPRLTVGAWRLRTRAKARGPVQPLRLRPGCTAFRTPEPTQAPAPDTGRLRVTDGLTVLAYLLSVGALLAVALGALA